ncbi:MAG: hypothetical protein GWN62_03810, partial [Aliifodinibius sp.]|nr:hypothetical protein [Fodinibius sp.]
MRKASDMSVRVAVVGAGAWGKNLIRNFYQLDSLIFICDKDRLLLQER